MSLNVDTKLEDPTVCDCGCDPNKLYDCRYCKYVDNPMKVPPGGLCYCCVVCGIDVV